MQKMMWSSECHWIGFDNYSFDTQPVSTPRSEIQSGLPKMNERKMAHYLEWSNEKSIQYI